MTISRRNFIAFAAATAVTDPRDLLARAADDHRNARTRVALVGTGVRATGMWGRDLVRDYADYVQFVGLCDSNPGRLAYAKQYIGANCPTYLHTDFDRMVRETRPDQIIVTTVDATHDQYIIRGMELGCDILTEKPLTTDEKKAAAILAAQRRTGKHITVTHNYRYSPHRQQMWEILRSGRIGKITSVDFNWYLDTSHGAAYFRRWHGKRVNSGTLFVHKACHHFDLLNWWIDSDPEEVFARADLDYYGKNNSFRHTNCRPCPHKDKCQHYWNINTDPHLVKLYAENEKYDGYLRDGCVWDEKIDIYDKMSATVRYKNGAQVNWSCTTYSPYEGYRIAFNGTKGRLEAWIKERQPWTEPEDDELRITDNFGQTHLIHVHGGPGGHGGGDNKMRDKIFKDPNAADPYQQAAGVRDGVLAVLIGVAARQSVETGKPIRIDALTDIPLQVVRPRA
jgi:predicted dehydrogenase